MQWLEKEFHTSKVEQLSNSLDIPDIILNMLVQRGHDTTKRIKKFLNPDITHLHNPFLMPDMEKAVIRIKHAIKNKEKILIYGDKDVDGVTSVVLMKSILERYGINAVTFIPKDGYGLSNEVYPVVDEYNISLIITVDCGITDSEVAFNLKKRSIDVIITDHHEPQKNLPEAEAVIDPKRKDSIYPFRELSGCGVVFKLGHALHLSYDHYFQKELVVIDTETTGSNPNNNELIEIGAVKIVNGVVKDTFSSLIKPENKIPDNVINIHGITDEMCKNAPYMEEVIPKFDKFLGDAILVFHSAQFDLGFLQKEYKKHLNKKIKNQVIDTLEMSRMMYPGIRHNLGKLAESFCIEHGGLHRALADAMVTASILDIMLTKQNLRIQEYLNTALPLTALSTIADIVPLIDENRTIVKIGIKKFRDSGNKGLNILVNHVFSDRAQFTARDISWNLAPLINSAGRMRVPEIVIDLLLSDEPEKILILINKLLETNAKRKDLQAEAFDIADKIAEKKNGAEKVLVIYESGIYRGVTGIAASAIKKKYNKVSIVLAKEGKEAIGSMRCVDGVSAVDLLAECADFILKFGGHEAAAGLTVSCDKLEGFEQSIKNVCENIITEDILNEKIFIDASMESSDITRGFLEGIEMLEPFGKSNEYPVFKIYRPDFTNTRIIGANKDHIKTCIKAVDTVGWGMAENISQLNNGNEVIVKLGKNTFNAKTNWQFELLHIISENSPVFSRSK
ncbi:MAG: single-stranded-DNA-specific exonuclease RecJ [Elusimicrobiota bacterium]